MTTIGKMNHLGTACGDSLEHKIYSESSEDDWQYSKAYKHGTPIRIEDGLVVVELGINNLFSHALHMEEEYPGIHRKVLVEEPTFLAGKYLGLKYGPGISGEIFKKLPKPDQEKFMLGGLSEAYDAMLYSYTYGHNDMYKGNWADIKEVAEAMGIKSAKPKGVDFGLYHELTQKKLLDEGIRLVNLRPFFC